MSIDTIRRTFPGAPLGSYVCEEGWLVIDDEAWTADEWRARWVGGRPVEFHDSRHRANREAKRRQRERQRLQAAS